MQTRADSPFLQSLAQAKLKEEKDYLPVYTQLQFKHRKTLHTLAVFVLTWPPHRC